MSPKIPYGERESATDEFKRAEALEELHKIAREVVAMLNAEGGTIWIGVEEEAGRLAKIQGIDDPEGARRNLWNHLLDRIEPSLRSEEAKIQLVEAEGKTLLTVEVRPSAARRPYAALRRSDGRIYLIRVADRIRPMSREEIACAFAAGDEGEAREPGAEAVRRLLEEREKKQKASEQPLFWLCLEPSEDLEFDLQDRREEIGRLFMDARESGNRPEGWSLPGSFPEPNLRAGRLESGAGPRTMVLHRSGRLLWTLPLGDLVRQDADPPRLYPLALIEFAVSGFRAAAYAYRELTEWRDFQVAADLALFRVGGWALKPHSPDSIAYRFRSELSLYDEGEDYVSEKVRLFPARELIESPDLCAYRLLVRLYEAFGFASEQMPRELDPERGRLVFDR